MLSVADLSYLVYRKWRTTTSVYRFMDNPIFHFPYFQLFKKKYKTHRCELLSNMAFDTCKAACPTARCYSYERLGVPRKQRRLRLGHGLPLTAHGASVSRQQALGIRHLASKLAARNIAKACFVWCPWTLTGKPSPGPPRSELARHEGQPRGLAKPVPLQGRRRRHQRHRYCCRHHQRRLLLWPDQQKKQAQFLSKNARRLNHRCLNRKSSPPS